MIKVFSQQEAALLCLYFLSSVLANETAVKLQADTAVSVPKLEFDERIKAYIDKSFGEHFEVSVFTLVSPEYGEIIVGPTLRFKHLALNLSIGLETADMPLRGQAFVHWEDEHFEGFVSVETGGSGPWYFGYGIGTIGHLTVGLLTQRFDGIGPRLGVTSHGLEFWSAPMYDYEDKTTNILAGLSWIP